ncbi:MAG: hypothetical protein PW735_02660 [Acidobacteriaceae bacterium]|nr:hypothetical protein [Acidobacteriaceae bacterium]
MRRSLALLTLALPAALAGAQTPSAQPEQTPTLEQRLDASGEQAETMRTALPSFTCTMNGTSKVLRTQDGAVKKAVAFTGSIRSRRLPSGALEETHEFSTFNDKHVNPRATLPFFVENGFTRVLTYGDSSYQPCYEYTLDEQDSRRVNFTNGQPFNLACGNFPGTKGFFTFNDAGEVDHVERRIPAVEDPAWPVPFASVDLATVDLGGTPHRLASHMISERIRGKETLREDVRFTDCRLFTTSIRILPADAGTSSDSTATPPPQ